jgi:hypothetical protein
MNSIDSREGSNAFSISDRLTRFLSWYKNYPNNFRRFFLFCSLILFLFTPARADYTVASGTSINASTLTGQTGVLTINGTLTVSSNDNLAGFTSVIINAPNGKIYWSNNSDLTFSAGTTININTGAPGLQSNGNNGSQRLLIGGIIIAVSSTHSNNSPFDFTQFNALGGLPEYTTGYNNNVCAGSAIKAYVSPSKIVSGVTYSNSWTISPSSGTFSYNTNNSEHDTATIYPTGGSYTLTCIASANGYNDTFNMSITVITVATPVPTSNSPVCSGSSLNLSTPAVSGATYSWSGPNGFTSVSRTPSISNASSSNSGTYSVSVTSGGCSSPMATTPVTITTLPSATISYTGTPFCTSVAIAQPVTRAGTSGGTYSASPAGLSINSSTGAITPSSSTAGTYTVTYTMATSGGCSTQTTTTSVAVNLSYTWLGTTTNWSDLSNWCPGLPTFSNNITIPSTSNNPVIQSETTAQVNNLTVASGATLTVNGTLQVAGTITNNGTIDATNGTIEMNGSSAQTIAGSMFYNTTIKNLIASNPAGLSVSSTAGDTLKISGGLTFGNSSATLNTGDNIDFLSTSTGTAYLGVVGSGNTITGKAIVDRYINIGTASGQHAKSWEFLAAPTNGQTIKQSWMENGSSTGGYGIWLTGPGGTGSGFDASSPGVAIKTYNPTTNGWDAVSNTSSQVNNANGYMIFIRGDRTVNGTTVTVPKTTILRSKGNLITGSQSAISVSPDHYQSIGNPYASPIDFTQLSRVDGVDDLFYAWDPYLYGVYGYGGYQTLSATNGWEPVPGGTSAYPSGVAHSTIQSGQAFFVHATSNTSLVPQNPTISISENAKVSGSSNVNFARVASRVASPERQYLRTDLFLSSAPGAPVADGNAVAFDNSFSNKVDGNDALKLMNSAENFGLKRDGKELAVEAKAPVTSADTLFYTMTNMRQQTYQLRIVPVNMQSDNLQAFLIDQFLNTSTALSLSDTTLVTFSVTGNAASKASNRFSVVFRQMAALTVTLTSVRATAQNNDILVEWATQNESGILQYEVEKSTDGNNFQNAGVINAQNNGSQNYQWIDSQPNLGNNYYRIRIVSKDGKISYSDIVKVYVGKTTASILVAPNPILNGVINLEFRHEPLGKYVINITNLAGQSVLSRNLNHRVRDHSETIEAPSITPGVYQLSITRPDGNIDVIKIVCRP